ncbi:permease [Exiguobacterium flavidum]|uniref:permease n=1 Tax=Exiguobacterium flavidum TaxID=2184695 RepID=UPI000DF75DFC|nr:permease [Exiguobacterium flavidum]
MKNFKKKSFPLFVALLFVGLFIADPARAMKATLLTGNSLLNMLLLLPPILVLVGLLDQWVRKETLLRYMGPDAGTRGFVYALLLAAFAAGPLYVAFPIATLLLKKGAGLRYIVFFLGAFTTVKLPVLLYEIASFGIAFTMLHIGFGLTFFFIIALLFERYQPVLRVKQS